MDAFPYFCSHLDTLCQIQALIKLINEATIKALCLCVCVRVCGVYGVSRCVICVCLCGVYVVFVCVVCMCVYGVV